MLVSGAQAESITHVQGLFMFDYELKNRVRLKMETALVVDYGAGVPGRCQPYLPCLPRATPAPAR